MHGYNVWPVANSPFDSGRRTSATSATANGNAPHHPAARRHPNPPHLPDTFLRLRYDGSTGRCRSPCRGESSPPGPGTRRTARDLARWAAEAFAMRRVAPRRHRPRSLRQRRRPDSELRIQPAGHIGADATKDAFPHRAYNVSRLSSERLNNMTAPARRRSATTPNATLVRRQPAVGTTAYAYDFDNRLVSASNGAALVYDRSGGFPGLRRSGGTIHFPLRRLRAGAESYGALTRRTLRPRIARTAPVWSRRMRPRPLRRPQGSSSPRTTPTLSQIRLHAWGIPNAASRAVPIPAACFLARPLLLQGPHLSDIGRFPAGDPVV